MIKIYDEVMVKAQIFVVRSQKFNSDECIQCLVTVGTVLSARLSKP